MMSENSFNLIITSFVFPDMSGNFFKICVIILLLLMPIMAYGLGVHLAITASDSMPNTGWTWFFTSSSVG